MTDNVAVLQGFTRQVYADSTNGEYSLLLLIEPDADLDGRFKAWDCDEQEFLSINGWNWDFEDVPEGGDVR